MNIVDIIMIVLAIVLVVGSILAVLVYKIAQFDFTFVDAMIDDLEPPTRDSYEDDHEAWQKRVEKELD